MARRKGALGLVRSDEGGAPARRNRVNFFELAYQRIEDLLVNCELKPGRFLTVQELQNVTGFGRTPVHNAVNQFAADTLIIIKPRHGLQIASSASSSSSRPSAPASRTAIRHFISNAC
jgi:DNA-binding GntR family transcriptional regulator